MDMKVGRQRGRGVLVTILLLVNGAAMWGQAGWATDHIVPARWDWRAGLALALAFAAALELIGVYLALSADAAEDAGVPSGGIRLASYAQGIVSGALNASHFGWFGAAGVAFGLMSAISPFLWSIQARIRRGRPVAPSRRLWHPIRSIALIRHMAWEGITDEASALSTVPARVRGEAKPSMTPLNVPQTAIETYTPAPAPVAAPTAPTTFDTDLRMRRLVESLQAGMSAAEAAEFTSYSVQHCRNYRAALVHLIAAPDAPLPANTAKRVNADVVEAMREWVRSEAAK